MSLTQAAINSVLFSMIGMGVFVVGFYILDKITPYKLWIEIIEKQNQALAILVGACALALGLIVSSAIH